MRWQQNTCPTCAKPAAELAEMVAAQALLTYDEETGEYEYAGESRVCWDGQETLEVDSSGRSIAIRTPTSLSALALGNASATSLPCSRSSWSLR